VGTATLYPWSEVGDWVFCEKCGWWDTIETCPQRLSAGATGDIAERLKNDDPAVLSTAPLAAPEDMAFLQLQLATCRKCDECNYLDLERVVVTLDKEGKPNTKSEKLIQKLPKTALARIIHDSIK